MLGETPLSSRSLGRADPHPNGGSVAAAAADLVGAPAGAASRLLPAAPAAGISEADRSRLLGALQGNFVKGQVTLHPSPLRSFHFPGVPLPRVRVALQGQDMGHVEPPEGQVGLRLGSANSAAAAAVLASFSGRFASGGSSETAIVQPPPSSLTGGLQQPPPATSVRISQCGTHHTRFDVATITRGSMPHPSHAWLF